MNRPIAAIVLLAITSLSVSLRGAKPVPEQPAVVAVRCAFSSSLWCGAIGSAAADAIRGDGSPYTAVLDAVREMRFQPQDSGFGRVVWLDFRNGPDLCSGCLRDFDTLFLQTALFHTNVVDASGNEVSNGLLSIPVGGWSYARLKIAFSRVSAVGQVIPWAVRFNPQSYPGSDYVTVTRPAPNTWNVEATDSDRALLVANVGKRNVGPLIEGPFSMPFKITVVSSVP